MGHSVRIPVSLQVVAYLFILSGIDALIDVVTSAAVGRLPLNFDVLGLFIGWGLLRLNPTWRTVALVFCALGMAATLVVGFVFLVQAAAGRMDFNAFGRKVGGLPVVAGAVLIVVFFTISFWQYWVLTRPPVRALFVRRPAEG